MPLAASGGAYLLNSGTALTGRKDGRFLFGGAPFNQQAHTNMLVAKLSTDKIVQVLSEPRNVMFAPGLHVLVCDRLTPRRGRQDPYWVAATRLVWKMNFADKNEDGSTFSGKQESVKNG